MEPPLLQRRSSAGWGVSMGVADEVASGMHVVVNTSRQKLEYGGTLPTVEYPIETSSRPAPTNVAEVTAARPDGSCDAVLVCNCHAGLRHARERPATEDDLLVCTPCTPGAAPCGAGRRIEGVASTQRQVVCSGCMQVSALRTPHSGGLISEVSSRRCTLGGLISEVSSRRSHLGGLISEGSSRRAHLGGQPRRDGK